MITSSSFSALQGQRVRSYLFTTFCSMNDDRNSLGSHPLIARLLKGVYVLRPPTPRYSSTWDVSKVTDYLRL